MILFTILRGISAPCLYSFHPFGVSTFKPCLVTGVSLHSTPACDLATPSGFPLAHPAMSQGLHLIPPLPVVLPPLRGSSCAPRPVTGATFHSTPACDLATPSGFPPMRQHIAVEIANPEGVARSQAGVQRSETPAEPTFPHHFEPRRGDRIIPFTPPGFPFHTITLQKVKLAPRLTRMGSWLTRSKLMRSK